MKNKIFTDPRITAKKTSIKQYILIVALLLVINATYLSICTTLSNKGDSLWIIVGASATFVAVVGAGLIFLFTYLRLRYISTPTFKICDAMHRMAAGDFSVTIPPTRTDGLKDEFEVLYEDLNTMAAELRSVEILKSDFVANVSHELKAPLSVIQTYATLLQGDGLSDAERKEYSAKISDATKRMTDLVTNILQLSRLENQKIHADKKPYVLSEQLCRCTLNFEQILDEKELELDTDFDDTVILNSDEQLLDIVFNNLLSNALKFTGKGGTIRITSKSENGYAVVSVADSGCGMTENEIKHIFEKFYQADASHATKGNGLGLALTYQIIKLLDGTIDVKSEVGKGSLFTVKFKLN